MADKVDRVTMICHEHDVLACEVCMVDDFIEWRESKRERYHQLKQEWRDTPVNERFDLGGES